MYTFNAKTQDATVVDAATGKVVGTVPLGGKPETGVADGKGNVYVNIEDQQRDRSHRHSETHRRANTIPWRDATSPARWPSTWPIGGCSPDAAARSWRSSNPDAGKLVTTVDIGGGVDAGAFNPKTQQIFMSCGDGVLTVIHED